MSIIITWFLGVFIFHKFSVHFLKLGFFKDILAHLKTCGLNVFIALYESYSTDYIKLICSDIITLKEVYLISYTVVLQEYWNIHVGFVILNSAFGLPLRVEASEKQPTLLSFRDRKISSNNCNLCISCIIICGPFCWKSVIVKSYTDACTMC
jgi:hypothetical protein